MRISKELSGAYAGYRLVQLEDGTGYIKCQNFAYKYDAKDKRLYYTQPKSIYGWTTEGVPNLEDFLKDNPTPGGAYRIRF